MMNKLKILVLNGPNLNLIGIREVKYYGKIKLSRIKQKLLTHGEKLEHDLKAKIVIDWRDSVNSEGKLIEAIHECVTPSGTKLIDGIIINPAALTHTSVALRDSLSAVSELGIPAIEVHLSNTLARESFRHRSLTAPVCIGQIMGFLDKSYILALDALVDWLLQKHEG